MSHPYTLITIMGSGRVWRCGGGGEGGGVRVGCEGFGDGFVWWYGGGGGGVTSAVGYLDTRCKGSLGNYVGKDTTGNGEQCSFVGTEERSYGRSLNVEQLAMEEYNVRSTAGIGGRVCRWLGADFC